MTHATSAVLSSSLLLLLSSSALAQGTTPAPAPAPAPTTPTPTPGPDPTTAPEPAPAPAPEPPTATAEPAADPHSMPVESEPTVSAKYDKGFTLATSDEEFELKAGVRSQFRIEIFRADQDDAEFQTHFVVPRLRLQLEGFAFGKDNTYKVEFDMANKGSALLKDFFVNHAFSPTLQVRAGQWKKPFSRHEIVSDFGSEFNERAIVNEWAGAGRDLGVALHNGYEKSPDGIEWAVGMFNGTGEKPKQTVTCTDPMDASTCTPSTPTNVPADFDPELVARVGFNTGGIKGYSEGDLEGGPFRLGVAASYRLNFNQFKKDADDALVLEHGIELDGLVKVENFDAQAGLYFVKVGDADLDLGFLVQAGYFVVPETAEFAARFSLIPDEAVEDESLMETRLAFDWYFSGHNFKWASDVGFLSSSAAETNDFQIRSQLQLVF
jgi:phosphate-selective porin OprO/OprP